MNYWTGSICNHCRWMREIISGKGSRFLMCTRSSVDDRFSKYPPQPMQRCVGHEPPLPGEQAAEKPE
ncbi:hypothetical protein Psta_2823 [Pirellula staleyi DSM 6068]|uniref:Uncharacterized protein n=1 Tax=Pirellula staleyi (strain ATCC 27377 / DSM 6068 / ICPB 4128) TaxID=530564 RepID=D2R7R3_PIRSD|nr:hypothetical protein [Pirellula staleyi]ADB17489.1 hypothetical protein Psta_2823 [Pirellula staleyi DSM 6068]